MTKLKVQLFKWQERINHTEIILERPLWVSTDRNRGWAFMLVELIAANGIKPNIDLMVHFALTSLVSCC